MQPSKQCLEHHVAVRLKDCIVLVATYTQAPEQLDVIEIWTYNLWTEKWKAHTIQKLQQAHRVCNAGWYCAVAVEADAYIFGGLSGTDTLSKLTRNKDHFFELTAIQTENRKKMASPRGFACGWEHGKKLWIFGGLGLSPTSYLNDHGDFVMYKFPFRFNNQLLSYDPFIQTWKNVACFGDVPSPRWCSSTAAINDKVWLYGGVASSGHEDDLYELNMLSLSWTQVQANMPRPPALGCFSLRPITANQLALHGSQSSAEKKSTWIFYVNSHTWKQHHVSEGHCLNHHTGITGLYNDVVIIGKHAMVTDQNTISISSVQLAPKSLQQLAIRMIYENRSTLPWNILPPKLRNKMWFAFMHRLNAHWEHRARSVRGWLFISEDITM